MTAQDLAAYQVREREPLWGSYRGHRVASMPPPSAGGAILIGLLQALEFEDARAGGYRPERFLHFFVEVEKRLFARRAADLGDPAFVPGATAAAAEMVSPAQAVALHAQVGERATPADALGPGAGPGKLDGNTTHLSVVDAEGNAVALTSTVNRRFGSGVAVPGTGILLNDEMDDFDAAAGAENGFGLVGGEANLPAPGKRPLSSMAPALVFAPDGRLLLAVGSPGGATIPSTVAWVVLRVVDGGLRLDRALGTPRIHHQWKPDRILAEPGALSPETRAALEARGHGVRVAEEAFGNPQAVRVDPATGHREAASDPRGEGRPAVP
jgi:gamma-glutamyltranspeptidase/glutathione hydrolase